MAKRNQKPEVRKAQREQAVRAAKDQKKATVKKPAVKVYITCPWIDIESLPCSDWSCHLKPSQDKAAQKAQKATKNAPKAGPGRVGGKR